MSEPQPASVLKFPERFLWGTATASTQIEGNVLNEWTDVIAKDGNHCRVACDSYNRYSEDVQWLSELGVNAYRMGIEWSRLQDRPFAPLNQRELIRYCHLLDQLQAAGITPMVVLHHFSNPPWISAAGGWLNKSTVAAFVDYVGKLVSALRGRVRIWNTFNEPDTYASLTYLLGEFPPFLKYRLFSMRRVIRNMAEAHEQVCHLIRSKGSELGPVEVGFSKNWTIFQAYRDWSLWDRSLAAASHWLFNDFVLGAFLGGTRKGASTYLGVNYYGRVRYHHLRALVPVNGFTPEHLAKMGVICDDMFERQPQGMEQVLKHFHKRYGLPMYITEHGAASVDETFRARDLKENLSGLHRASSSGVDMRGFFYWSLMDNFEWQFGYSKKFGLVDVDFTDRELRRSMKPLGRFYRQICTTNSLEP